MLPFLGLPTGTDPPPAKKPTVEAALESQLSYLPDDLIMEAAAILKVMGGNPAEALCALDKRFEAVCKLDGFWQTLCDARDWNRLDRLDWSRKILKIPENGNMTYKQHYSHWHKLSHSNESLKNALARVIIREIYQSVDEHEKYGPLKIWDTSQVTDMRGLFMHRGQFNADISKWDTSNVENMSQMFRGAKAFNQDISKWDTSKVTSMEDMFHGASVFNQDISEWKTDSVTNMEDMFHEALAFNQDISGWNTSSLRNTNNMFWGATAFTYREKVKKIWQRSYIG